MFFRRDSRRIKGILVEVLNGIVYVLEPEKQDNSQFFAFLNKKDGIKTLLYH